MSDARKLTGADIAGLLTNGIICQVLTGGLINRGTYRGDLDQLKTEGIYLVAADSVTSTLGLPFTAQGIVEVINRYGGVLQRFTAIPTIRVIQRTYASVTQTWSQWVEFQFKSLPYPTS